MDVSEVPREQVVFDQHVPDPLLDGDSVVGAQGGQ